MENEENATEEEDGSNDLLCEGGFKNCPFCGGSKIKPFMSPAKSQHCNECNEYGLITLSKLRRLDLA